MTDAPGRAIARADRVLPGLWRLRVPLPWAATPHGNAYAVAGSDGVVLFDCGIGGPDGLEQLEIALLQAGFRLRDVRLLACTHTHADHYGAAASVAREAGCEVWLHPAWAHVRLLATDPERALERRAAFGRSHGAPEELLARLVADRRRAPPGFDGVVEPARELVDGTEVETGLGRWIVRETPGHAPSHVVFHQPERRLLVSGDALVGKTFLYFDYGHTPDPVEEFRRSLGVVEALGAELCVSGHGRPFRDIPAKAAAYRAELDRQLAGVRAALGPEPRSAYDLIAAMTAGSEIEPFALGYLLELTVCYLAHLEARGEARRLPGGEPVRWARSR